MFAHRFPRLCHFRWNGIFWHIAGTQHTDRTLEEFHRDIPVGYYLRPIPQGQLDGLEMTDEEKVLYQNPAYRN